MKHKRIYVGLIVMISLIIVFLIGKRELFNEYFSPVKLQYLESYLNNNYLYEIDGEKGLENVYAGFLEGVENKVTYYLKQEDFTAAKVQEAGNYFGTGMTLMWSLDGQSFLVTELVKGSPAEKAGIRQGDKITKVNDTLVLMSNSHKLMEEIFSNSESPVSFSVSGRDGDNVISLTPAEVQLADIESQSLEGALYVKVNALQEGTADRIEKLLEKTDLNRCRGVILDIRSLYSNNIEEAGRLCDLFLEEGTAFKVKAKDDSAAAYTMKSGAIKTKLCLVTNTSTKGAAEAAVLGLKEKAKVVGSDTAGLKYIRKLVSLGDGSGMSVARGIIEDQYGNELSEEGVEPDVRVYIGEKEKKEMLETGNVELTDDSFVKAALKAIDEM